MRAALLSMTLLLACGEKSAPPASSLSATRTVSLVDIEIPGDAKSKDFALLLLGTTLTEFQPTDSSGAKFVYKTMRFSNGNTWSAEAYLYLEAEDIRIDCKESGSWSMNPADSSSVAGVTWKVESSDCSGREGVIGSATRAVMTLGKGGLEDIKFR
jgi:hypothetical protein